MPSWQANQLWACFTSVCSAFMQPLKSSAPLFSIAAFLFSWGDECRPLPASLPASGFPLQLCDRWLLHRSLGDCNFNPLLACPRKPSWCSGFSAASSPDSRPFVSRLPLLLWLCCPRGPIKCLASGHMDSFLCQTQPQALPPSGICSCYTS